MLRDVAPATGHALEIASGTGQHIVQLAAALPGLIWQPSDIDPARLASIAAWADDAPLPNLRSACRLDATKVGWAEKHANQDVILL
ncbi:MAG TPA: methyltransferase, partial [Rhodobacteraceae bacterium]|nr:methyltransferase [Paracoccaceae bacterium]